MLLVEWTVLKVPRDNWRATMDIGSSLERYDVLAEL